MSGKIIDQDAPAGTAPSDLPQIDAQFPGHIAHGRGGPNGGRKR